jgi:hypothetical protein
LEVLADEPTTTASVPFMITQAMKAELRARGYADDQIRGLTTQEANAILAGPVCEHCGAPATAEAPVQECWLDGERALLHRGRCQKEWSGDGCG